MGKNRVGLRRSVYLSSGVRPEPDTFQRLNFARDMRRRLHEFLFWFGLFLEDACARGFVVPVRVIFVSGLRSDVGSYACVLFRRRWLYVLFWSSIHWGIVGPAIEQAFIRLDRMRKGLVYL